MSDEIDAFDAQTKFASLLDRVARGEQIVITRKGRAVAKLVRHEPVATVAERRAAIERIASLADKRTLNGISWKSLRDGGRKS
jgi:prevent-host-death family protein